ncbi:hypothetical protein APR09_002733 [Nocardia amikacinitolerans]|nr:hypothetical protein [Nocardia amikacinitolerans]
MIFADAPLSRSSATDARSLSKQVLSSNDGIIGRGESRPARPDPAPAVTAANAPGMVRRRPRRPARCHGAHGTPRYRPAPRTRLPGRLQPRSPRRLPAHFRHRPAAAAARRRRSRRHRRRAAHRRHRPDRDRRNSAARAGQLEQVLPARLRGRVTGQTVTALHYTGDGPQADPAVLATVAAACRRRVTPRPLPARDPAAFVADKIAEAPVRYRAVATVAASAEFVATRSWAHFPIGSSRSTGIPAHSTCPATRCPGSPPSSPAWTSTTPSTPIPRSSTIWPRSPTACTAPSDRRRDARKPTPRTRFGVIHAAA